MNIAKIRKTLLLAIGGVFVWWAWKSPAQDATAANASLQMPYAVTQVLELEQAKIGDSTIIAYINSSGTSFNLTAAQIVFLRQQGVSDAVITAMLTQPRAGVTAPTQAAAPAPAPAPAPQYASAASTAGTTDPVVISQPSVTYVQTTPTPVSYDYSCYYPYPTYAWYGWPFCWTWYGGGWHWGWRGGWAGWHGEGRRGTWGGEWHDGWRGGWHGGENWHGGGSWHGSWGGGGWHGGGSWHGGGGWHR